MGKCKKQIPALYIHIPFCDVKCIYCDFYSLRTPTNINNIYHAFIKALKQEISIYKTKYPTNTFGSVYIGGGTPSILPTNCMEDMLAYLYKNFSIEKTAEITIECNPNSITKDKLSLYKTMGINRINLGCQSFNDKVLHNIGRRTTRKEIIEKYALINKIGFKSVNIDLIYGLPGQSLGDYKNDLKEAIHLGPKHLSLYGLSYSSKLYRIIEKNKLTKASEQTLLKEYLLSHALTKENGYIFYEVSNFAKKGNESRHNKAYWQQKDYLGFGASAVGTVNKKRYTNTNNLKQYIMLLEQGKLPIEQTEVLDDDIIRQEKIMLSLRTKEGLDMSLLKEDKHWYKAFEQKVLAMEKQKLIKTCDNNIIATKKGMLYLNQIIVNLI